jgi:peptidoglycan/xylan/chitin deacetylase (PgdA/CDA1 family)
MVVSQRERLAWLCGRVGLLRVLERLINKPGLLVLNYHRLGPSVRNELDDDVFSANPAEFRSQLRYLRENFDVIGLDDLLRMVEGGSALDRPCVLLTFDDGYRDSFDLGFPILQELGLPAVFFIATEFIQSSRLPWWDRIAYSLKNTDQETLTLDYPVPLTLDLRQDRRIGAIRQVQVAYKHAYQIDDSAFFHQLDGRLKVRVDPESLGRGLFMSWEQIRALRRGGMDIGAHTHTHPVLAQLPEPDQWSELVESKRVLESELGEEVIAMSYPVGGKQSFTGVTKRLAREAGYRLAFSYHPSIIRPGRLEPFEIQRVSVDASVGFPLFRTRTISYYMLGYSVI